MYQFRFFNMCLLVLHAMLSEILLVTAEIPPVQSITSNYGAVADVSGGDGLFTAKSITLLCFACCKVAPFVWLATYLELTGVSHFLNLFWFFLFQVKPKPGPHSPSAFH